MKQKIFIVMKEDIINYPPALTVIRTLVDLGYKVVHIGRYSDVEQKKDLAGKGVSFVETEKYNGQTNLVSKFLQQKRFKKTVFKTLAEYGATKDDYVWLLNAETIVLLSDLANHYKTIFHYFEFTTPYINWKYRILNPSFNPYELNKKAYKIVQCEYNRAHIFKAFLHLDNLPIVLPNKPYDMREDELQIPSDVSKIVEDVKHKIGNRKAILYQGVFQGKDRRLDEFVEAISLLPEDFVFIAMGSDSPSYREMREKYESDRVIFVPFIRPPYHLQITKLCYIGILSYVANENSVAGTINPIYCAPNKIFEYSKFRKPMLSNDLPGLSTIFKQYDCGACVNYPITASAVRNVIATINDEYSKYSNGSNIFYNSVDLQIIIEDILS